MPQTATAAAFDDQADATPPRLMLTVEQAAEALGIGRTTTFALVKSGELDSVRIGRLRRIPADAVNAYLATLETDQAQ